jgi:ABC-type glycerol-3-phosphate transport system substrate-binding protein
LLNFAQSEIHRVNDIGFFDDGRIYVLSIFWNTDGEQEVNLYILTPVEREVFDERILLTLGGVNIGTDTYQAVARFNISSSTHEIIVEEYNLTGDLMEGTRDAFSRLEIDLITGRGPDIIYNVWDAVLDRGMLLDLHPFIHADAGLSIEDFVPSFLASLESPDGSLYMLASEFWIDTMVGNAEVIGHIDIESWTIEAFLELLEANSHMELPLGAWMTSEQFVHIMLRAEADYFVCQTTLTANFDNEAFINILEMAKFIHDSTDVTVIETLPHGYFRLLYGDQLLLRFAAFSADNYFLFSTVNEDLTVLGFPTTSGGVHITFPYSSPLGINAATEHPDAAWEFLRHVLLPRDNINLNFPIRMDMFEDIIENRTTPLLELDEEGNSMEVSLGSVDFGDGTIVRLYSATEEAVETLRYVVEAAQPDDSLMAGELWFSVLIEDLAPFLAGTRTVEDTVRIMQNRAQTFLNERG